MNLARPYAAVLGVALVVMGLLGFLGNPLVGDGSGGPVFVTGVVHNLLHLMTGALALYIAFGLKGTLQAEAVIGLGVAYLVFFVITLLSPTLFGILNYPANGMDHLLHLAVGVSGVAVGWAASGRRAALPARR